MASTVAARSSSTVAAQPPPAPQAATSTAARGKKKKSGAATTTTTTSRSKKAAAEPIMLLLRGVNGQPYLADLRQAAPPQPQQEDAVFDRVSGWVRQFDSWADAADADADNNE